ncbi:glucose-6-phosphate isomerase [Marinobacter halophilus]|uniref:Glucose-6-phosphate isomerase n=1 Tax=Marinobacter halophilus TaxID=1323740 RepID=A0A2T1KK58_9GAMM|nr:glucose-6-phosphate isomerase [Marinobacter halophilus]PSF10398.1 glucose-6-phosphate isomerase [Marinobacter halophilus]GGC70398.1 glucose-6-phosphate isomerase [Marinobacter halophilus]
MADKPATPTHRPQWQALVQHKERLTGTSMREFFQQDPERANRYLIDGAGLTLDFSRNRLTDDVLTALTELADACGLSQRKAALFAGDIVNITENRPALHTALRQPSDEDVRVDGNNIITEIHTTLARMEKLVAAVHSGKQAGYTGKTFTDVVSIGIGGSFLGPKLVVEALKPYWQGNVRCHFVANIDGTNIAETLSRLDPETTLFLIQSKSFRTQETLENSLVARQWFMAHGGAEAAVASHFLAVTTNIAEATRFGIDPGNIFPMWDWVGGRYSLWSAIGLPIALTLGMDHFRALLNGAHAMDCHFRDQPAERNLPVVMAMLSVWYNNFWGAESHAVVPYDEYLKHLPEHLQQLDMESNGKRVSQNGQHVDYQTGPILWGGIGANGQHAYHQLIHQGTRLIPVDFIIPLQSHHAVAHHHATLFANCLSQARAMMAGKTRAEAEQEMLDSGVDESTAKTLATHKEIPGNKPSNILMMNRLNPETLGALIALYEHRTFVQSVIWDLDCFDQWGVELGKQIGNEILPRLLDEEKTGSAGDSATDHLIRRFRSANRP